MRKIKKKTMRDIELCNDKSVIDYFRTLNSLSSKKTMNYNIKSFVQVILKFNPNFVWEELNDSVIGIAIDKLLQLQQSPTTINTKLCAIKGVAKRLWIEERLDGKIYQLIYSIKNVRGSRLAHGRMLSKQELKSIFDKLDKQDCLKQIRDAAIFAVMVGTGLRRGEVAKLLQENIYLSEKNPFIRVIGKGNKERQIPLPAFTQKYLKEWIELKDNPKKGFVFVQILKDETITNKGLSGCSIYNICENYVSALNMKKWTPHDLRRTCASMLIEKGFDMTSVRDYLGHASISTTQLYDKRSLNRLDDLAKNISI